VLASQEGLFCLNLFSECFACTRNIALVSAYLLLGSFVSASSSGLGSFLFTRDVLKHVVTNSIEFRAVEEIS
jgi:hypothetical protein